MAISTASQQVCAAQRAAGTRVPTYIFNSNRDLARSVARTIAAVIRERNSFGQNAVLGLPTGSTPTGLAFYDSSTLPELEGALLVVLNGSRNRVDLRGYVLAAVAFDDSGRPAGSEILIPYQTDIYQNTLFDVVEMNYRGSGFWPHRPLDVTISPEGWVYLSVSGGRIMVLRPS